MKKTCFILAAALVALVSCNKEAVLQKESSLYEPYTICATGDQTKTQLATNGKSVLWEAGETIRVWGESDETGTSIISEAPAAFTSGQKEPSTTANFTGQVPTGSTTVYAISPYDNSSYSGGHFTAVIPAAQTLTNGSYASGSAICFAKASRQKGETAGNFTFNNLCNIIKFQVPSTLTVTKIEISSNNENDVLAGTAEISVDGAITSVSGSKTVTISGTATGDGTYYAVIAPGTCSSGLSFTVYTDDCTYSASTTKGIADTSTIYNLGKLGLNIAKDINPSVSISHIYENNILTGSKAVISDPPTGLKSWTIYLKQGTTTCATLKSTSQGNTMTNADGLIYIPKGDYYLEVKYTPENSAIERTLTFNKKCSSPALDNTKFGIQPNDSIYTSYSWYVKGGDWISKANELDGLTVYLRKTTDYQGIISEDVYNQCKSSFSITGRTDNGTKITDYKDYTTTRGAHAFVTSWKFDGVTGSYTNNLSVTGLPYNHSQKDIDELEDWTLHADGGNGTIEYYDSGLRVRKGSYATYDFYIPGAITVNLIYDCGAYHGTRQPTTVFTVGETTIFEKTTPYSGNYHYKYTDSGAVTEATFSKKAAPYTTNMKFSGSCGSSSFAWGYSFINYIRVDYK